MRGHRGTLVLALVAVAGLSACGNGEPRLMTFNTDDGPDEFSIVPTQPLQAPDTYAELPAPTPGGRNLADPTPEEDAVAALGGRASGSGVRGSEGAVVSYAARYGMASDIRGVLAAEDRQFREENQGRLLERLFNVNVYYSAYSDYSLDQYAELERLRAAGIWTPAAPPDVPAE